MNGAPELDDDSVVQKCVFSEAIWKYLSSTNMYSAHKLNICNYNHAF